MKTTRLDDQEAVQSVKIGSSYCAKCEKLVMEKGHEHFNK